ncbi:MAG: hypothetical protein KAT66_00425 [Candidatus Lokiarchaeota archaeon]|nr:hypothetical protein [Candidatus Lokiarchaeota archaeon]
MSSILKIEDLITRNTIINDRGETVFECWQRWVYNNKTLFNFRCFHCNKGFAIERDLLSSDEIEYYCDTCGKHILTVTVTELHKAFSEVEKRFKINN